MPTPHPGELVSRLILEPTGVSQSELARRLGFNQPQPVNELVKGKRGFTPKMALLFEKVTEGEFPAVFWLLAQARYDIERAREGLSPGRRAAVDAVSLPESAAELSQQASCEDLFRVAETLRA